MRVVTAAVRIVYPQTSIHGGFTSYQPETAPWLSERSITPYRKDIRRPNICKIFLAMFAIRSYNSIYIVALDDRQLLQTLLILQLLQTLLIVTIVTNTFHRYKHY